MDYNFYLIQVFDKFIKNRFRVNIPAILFFLRGKGNPKFS